MVVTDKCNSLVLWTLSTISALSQIASEAVTIYFPIIFSVVTDCIFRLLHQPSQFIVDLKTFSSVKNKTKRSLYLIIETLYYLWKYIIKSIEKKLFTILWLPLLILSSNQITCRSWFELFIRPLPDRQRMLLVKKKIQYYKH